MGTKKYLRMPKHFIYNAISFPRSLILEIKMDVKIMKAHPEALIPKYATQGAACFDLHALLELPDEHAVVKPGCEVVIRTGIKVEVPEGYVMEIYSRSGHGFKAGTRLVNCVGIIDSDYRGEIMVGLRNDRQFASEPLIVTNGDRIAQAKIVPVQQVSFIEVDELSETERGENGFGSTGGTSLPDPAPVVETESDEATSHE